MPKPLPKGALPLLLIGGLAALVVAWIAWVNVDHAIAAHRSCTIWSTQSSVQLNAKGPAAVDECEAEKAAGGWTDIPPDGPTGAHVVCQYELDGTSYTVRDTGMGIVGSLACDRISDFIESRRVAEGGAPS